MASIYNYSSLNILRINFTSLMARFSKLFGFAHLKNGTKERFFIYSWSTAHHVAYAWY